MTTVYENQIIKWIIYAGISWIIGFFVLAIFLPNPYHFWIATIAVIIIFLIKRPRKNGQDYDSFDYTTEHSTKKEIDTSRPLKIVKERLAKGEITTDEFNELKKEFE